MIPQYNKAYVAATSIKVVFLALAACVLAYGLFMAGDRLGQGVSGLTGLQSKLKAQDEAIEGLYLSFSSFQAGQARAEVRMVEKIDEQMFNLSEWIKAELEATKAEVVTAGQAEGQISGVLRRLQEEADHIYEGKGPDDPNRFYHKRITATAESGEEMAVAWFQFYPATGRIKTGVYPLKYQTEVIRAEQPSGAFQNYATLSVTNDADKESRGVKFPLKVNKLLFQEQIRKAKTFRWWNPALFIGATYGVNLKWSGSFRPAVGLYLASYGRTEADADWRFAGITGLFAQDEAGVALTPFAWRLRLPGTHNLRIGPWAGWTSRSGFQFGVGFSSDL